MKNTKIINANKKAWNSLRQTFPGLSDPKISIVASVIVRESNITAKLKPEGNDGKKDKMLKKIMERMMFG